MFDTNTVFINGKRAQKKLVFEPTKLREALEYIGRKYGEGETTIIVQEQTMAIFWRCK